MNSRQQPECNQHLLNDVEYPLIKNKNIEYILSHTSEPDYVELPELPGKMTNDQVYLPLTILAKLVDLLNDIAKEENILSQLQERHQEALEYSIHSGMRQLETQANCINAIAAQLEAEILRFTEIAARVNQAYHQLQQQKDCLNRENICLNYRDRIINICEVNCSKLPQIVKSGWRYVLTEKEIDSISQNHAIKAQIKRKYLENFLDSIRKCRL
ncbi:hypothetical protein [Coleofasciculus chthonoplastes]|uniref:hypothetical protein n=1 Tax=Coleofasciculus chthonoplastes TaxID=64178 RepID=UPI0032FD12F4